MSFPFFPCQTHGVPGLLMHAEQLYVCLSHSILFQHPFLCFLLAHVEMLLPPVVTFAVIV